MVLLLRHPSLTPPFSKIPNYCSTKANASNPSINRPNYPCPPPPPPQPPLIIPSSLETKKANWPSSPEYGDSFFPKRQNFPSFSLHHPSVRFLLSPAAGLPPKSLTTAIRRCPALLTTSVDHRLRPTLRFLTRLGLAPPLTPLTALLLISDVETTLLPKLEFLISLGFSFAEARNMIVRCPGLLTLSVENNFKPKIEFLLREMERNVKELKGFPQYFAFSLENRIKPRHRVVKENGLVMKLSEMLKPSEGEFRDRLLELRLAMLDDT